MTTEFAWVVWTGVLTLLMRAPWMFNKVAMRGFAKVSRYPGDSEPLSGWAHRIWVAHEDAVQNLIVFAVLAGGLTLLGESNAWTRSAAAVFFWARFVHFGAYVFAVPVVKTVAFATGFAAQLVLAWQLLLYM